MRAPNFAVEASKVLDLEGVTPFAGVVDGWGLRVAAGMIDRNAVNLAGAIMLANLDTECGQSDDVSRCYALARGDCVRGEYHGAMSGQWTVSADFPLAILATLFGDERIETMGDQLRVSGSSENPMVQFIVERSISSRYPHCNGKQVTRLRRLTR